ncbi:seipin isoform X2 [Eurytemora carolleeae]|nr:seipin isoform X2 [Eurytemora carolleeae]|eukprot:XP_023338551.1 seipin-like isoform X2 [Eurytemora affinis]
MDVMSSSKRILYNAIASVLTFVLIISISVFMYGTFYYAYMPLEIHEEPVNLQFLPCTDQVGICSYPNATVNLHPKIKLMTGQPYSVSVRLELPDSTFNQELGMFMSCLEVLKNDKNLETSCKSSILEFRSPLLRYLETFMFSPFLLTGTSSQKQWVTINFFRKFMDDPHNLANRMFFEIKSKHIQVYSTTLLVHAEFSGLRHIMFHHPWISSAAGILSNIVVLSLVILISWSRLFTEDEEYYLQHYDSGLHGEILKEDDLDKEEKEISNTDDIEILKNGGAKNIETIH